MADVFISYRNTPDRRVIVRRLAFILRTHGISVWWDYGLEAGESYRAQISSKLAAAKVVSPLWCAESISSEWVLMEAQLGKDKLIPARLQKVTPPDDFEAIQAADLVGWDGTITNPRLQAFVRLISNRLNHGAFAPPGDMIEELQGMPPITPLPELAPPPRMSPAGSANAEVFMFWEKQWEKHAEGTNLIALRAIAADAPRIFADQAKALIDEIEAGQRRQSEAHAPAVSKPKKKNQKNRTAAPSRREGNVRNRSKDAQGLGFALEMLSAVDGEYAVVAFVERTFIVPGAGIVAGVWNNALHLKRGQRVHIHRGDGLYGPFTIKSLQVNRRDVASVPANTDCGVLLNEEVDFEVFDGIAIPLEDYEDPFDEFDVDETGSAEPADPAERSNRALARVDSVIDVYGVGPVALCTMIFGDMRIGDKVSFEGAIKMFATIESLQINNAAMHYVEEDDVFGVVLNNMGGLTAGKYIARG